ncbi:hypothetical protein lacNasYZ03_09780 [Lactobacillus nasalidis]|uniref:HXXEE domain-containing protein n=1 Tax=Lactobacillus nasalidis TaxID=2797258 RepID=A0ABQ3W468_9LACO|nr:HXXEE domain-containing protein [Lactobacillus nasalidis]GHV96882.1 hypothetical protein lacNasYZ01_00640 [Lactobacillus nasalidis]GHW00174.1 hypothetical protein lacNasYZ02_16030 [Lactobacillus nasalidis]GHW01291.1 hypothetical protein lacNasYZ03_09780 [Lactobacillus nasalidis]
MKFLRNHWFHVGLVFFSGLAFYMVFWGQGASYLQKLLVASAMALFLHQTEEYILPGGASPVINHDFYGNHSENYDRFPGNWNSIMIVNVSAWIFYIWAIFSPKFIYLGAATMFFNLFQVLGHGIKMNVAMKTWYNPGMATSLLLFLPISLAYFIYVSQTGLLAGWGWLWSVLAAALLMAITVVLPVQLLKKEDSACPIPARQLEDYQRVKNFCRIKR